MGNREKIIPFVGAVKIEGDSSLRSEWHCPGVGQWGRSGDPVQVFVY